MPRARGPRRRPTLKTPEALGGLVGRVRYGTGPLGRPTVAKDVWERAVGPRIAERAQPIELDRGTLFVRVATSVWASELSLLAVTILERLRALGIEATALRCRVGAIEAPVRPAALRKARVIPPPLAVPAALARVLDTVADPELRATIASAASANLAWQAYVSDAARDAKATTDAGSRAARVPQSAERESGPPAQSSRAAPGASRRKP